MQRFLWLSIARDQPERPIRDFLLAGVPFVGPGKENRTGEPAFDHAVNVPTQHVRLLILSMPDGVHSKLAEDERPLFRKVLQTQKVTLEIALIVQVNIETKKID